ncbi:hypothetical protein HID58_073708, partial [Brassica napus]
MDEQWCELTQTRTTMNTSSGDVFPLSTRCSSPRNNFSHFDQQVDVVVGTIGDSRAVLATRDQRQCFGRCPITVDLKPDLPSESARIQKCKGESLRCKTSLNSSDSPGLAMARAFGDFCLKDYGLYLIPDINYNYRAYRRDHDGVWDVLSNKKLWTLLPQLLVDTAARALVDTAVRSWRIKYPTSKNDDCTDSHKEDSVESVSLSNKEEEEGARLFSCGTESKMMTTMTLAEYDEEWSALEGLTRVNSLLSIPRFLSGELRSASWRK